MTYSLTAKKLRSLLHYNPGTGVFIWLVAKKGHRAGLPAGADHNRGYRTITVNGAAYLAHRLAWLYMTGEWPKHLIDHKDGDKKNNRWENLREATPRQNGQNRGAQKNSKSGVKGVSWSLLHGKWTARIKAGGVYRNLGYFSTIDAAADAYNEAAQRHFGEFAKC